jgi:hypothetical protein
MTTAELARAPAAYTATALSDAGVAAAFREPALKAADLSVAKAVVAAGEDLAGQRHRGDLATPPLGDPLERGPQGASPVTAIWPTRRAAAGCASTGSRCSRAGPARRSFGSWARPSRRVSEHPGSGRRRPPRRSRAAPCNGQRRGAGQHTHLLVFLGWPLDLACDLHLAVEGGDEREEAVEPATRGLRSRNAARKRPPALRNSSP